MLLNQARMVYEEKWAEKHECEELKEEVWLEPHPSCAAKKNQ